MLQGEIKKQNKFWKGQKKDQSLLALTFETLNHDWETEINRNKEARFLIKKKLIDETKLKQTIEKIRVNLGSR